MAGAVKWVGWEGWCAGNHPCSTAVQRGARVPPGSGALTCEGIQHQLSLLSGPQQPHIHRPLLPIIFAVQVNHLQGPGQVACADEAGWGWRRRHEDRRRAAARGAPTWAAGRRTLNQPPSCTTAPLGITPSAPAAPAAAAMAALAAFRAAEAFPVRGAMPATLGASRGRAQALQQSNKCSCGHERGLTHSQWPILSRQAQGIDCWVQSSAAFCLDFTTPRPWLHAPKAPQQRPGLPRQQLLPRRAASSACCQTTWPPGSLAA